ncbi:ADP-ribosylglycohydrolase family protein [Phytomonospora sp. NPDC050363]|uniref:ADP-ribosylglycohydrolase family protein n=1 Tax=Phytomonospora sp. NPDC050363 TaxID=3155642 RepID=UPI0033C97B3C
MQPEDLVPHELIAARLEGRPVDDIERRWLDAGGAGAPPAKGASPEQAGEDLRALAHRLLDELDALPGPDPAAEPADLDGVRAHWPATWGLPGVPDTEALRERLHGAWLGRAAGCVLGKPVEGLPREGIAEILHSTGTWPLSGYFTARGLADDVAARRPWNRRSKATSLVENIDGMPEDDDLNYPLMALLLLEQHGADLTSEHVAASWLDLLPAGRTFTAERVAYRNLLLGLVPPVTATRHNPFREWIGAQIRTDLYGWAHPGDVALAAELAHRDAVVSHVRNGVYGAMFAAAMGAAAVVASRVDEVLDAGIAVLPPESRIAGAVREARELAASEKDWERVLDVLHERHGHLHWVHVVNNAALATAALVHGEGDFARTITAVVTGGWDTDSNGATVGGIIGALTGASALPREWTRPLRNRLATSIPGLDGIGFDTLAARTLALVPGRAE